LGEESGRSIHVENFNYQLFSMIFIVFNGVKIRFIWLDHLFFHAVFEGCFESSNIHKTQKLFVIPNTIVRKNYYFEKKIASLYSQ